MTHSLYLYAIVDRLPAPWGAPPAGITDAPVLPRRVGGLVVLASALDSVPPATARTLALHQDVVATVVDAGATLPLRYGVTVPVAELEAWLAAHRASVTAALGAVRGCVEMTVKLLGLEPATAAGAGAPGLQTLAETLADRAGLPQWRYRPSAGNAAAAVAFLVPRPDLAGFLARIAPVASHAAGIAVVPTGPWAPYSFVPDLGRAPLRHGPPAALATLGRRAG